MPYYEHTALNRNIDPNAKLWRYMDLSKFLSIIDSKTLYFTNPKDFEDPFEGITNEITKQDRRLKHSYLDEDMHKQYDDLDLLQRKLIGVNCWHENEYESAAMWNLYVRTGDGIAIQTTFQRFCNSFHLEEKDIFIGKVNYFDFERDLLSETVIGKYLSKRNSFEHEKEIRAIYYKNEELDINNPEFIENGIKINVDTDILIEKIYIAPKAPSYLRELIEHLIGKYNLTKDIIQSDLYKSPIK